MVCLYGQLRYDQRGLLVHEDSDVVQRRLGRLARAHITVDVKAKSEAPVLLFITLLLFLCVSQPFTAQSGSQRHPGEPAPLSCCQPHPKVSHLSLFCPFHLFSLLVG